MSDLSNILSEAKGTSVEQPQENQEVNDTEVASEVETTEETEIETEATTEEGKSDNKTTVPLKALQAERKKRQDAEETARNWEKRFDNRATVTKEEAPQVQEEQSWIDPATDPKGFANQMMANTQAMLEQQRINMSTSMVIESVGQEKYLEAEKVFLEAANKNPALIEQMQANINPAKFAYDYGLKAKEMVNFESIDDLKKSLREEILADLKAEATGKSAKGQSLTDSLPQETLTGVRGTVETAGEPSNKTIDIAGILGAAKQRK